MMYSFVQFSYSFEVGAVVRCVQKRAEDLLLCELAGRLDSLTLAEE